MKYTAIFLIIFASLTLYSQNYKETETILAGHLKKMNYYKYDSFNPDSVEIENANFKKLLLKYLGENQVSYSDSWDIVVKAGLMIARSDDKKLWIYSWDTQTGGTMHFYDNIYQYTAGDNKILIKESSSDTEGDPRSWYSQIYTMNDGGKKYYLGVSNSEYSTSEISQSINFFTIENNQLNTDLKIAKTKEGISSGLGINFNFFKLKGHDERPLEIVTYDPDNKTIRVPVVSDDGSLTGKVTLYKFTNGFFEAAK